MLFPTSAVCKRILKTNFQFQITPCSGHHAPCLVPFALRSMPHAPCPSPFALCQRRDAGRLGRGTIIPNIQPACRLAGFQFPISKSILIFSFFSLSPFLLVPMSAAQKTKFSNLAPCPMPFAVRPVLKKGRGAFGARDDNSKYPISNLQYPKVY